AVTEAVVDAHRDEGVQERSANREPKRTPSTCLGVLPAIPAAATPQEEFLRMLRLSNVDTMSMSDDQRDTFIDMAENLGLDPGEAEDLVDLYLEEADEKGPADLPKPASKIAPPQSAHDKPSPAKFEHNADLERARYANFTNSLGGMMI